MQLNTPPLNTPHNSKGLESSDFKTRALNAFAGISMQLLTVFTALPEAEAAVPPSFSTEEIQKFKQEGNRDPLERALQSLKAIQSELEAEIERMETGIAGLKAKRQELEALAVEAKDMPEATRQIEALRGKMDAGIARSEEMLKDSKRRVEEARKNLTYIERILREVDDAIKQRKQDKK